MHDGPEYPGPVLIGKTVENAQEYRKGRGRHAHGPEFREQVIKRTSVASHRLEDVDVGEDLFGWSRHGAGGLGERISSGDRLPVPSCVQASWSFKNKRRLPAATIASLWRSVNVHGCLSSPAGLTMPTPLEIIAASAFERSLQQDAGLEECLGATPPPRHARAAGTLFRYLLALDYSCPDDVFSAQDTLARFLMDRNVPAQPSPQAADDCRCSWPPNPGGSTWTPLSCKGSWQKRRPT